jgi:hypothetical protein
MEISQGSSQCSYLYLKQATMSCFSFYLFSFSFNKIGEQDKKSCSWGMVCFSGRGRDVGERE